MKTIISYPKLLAKVLQAKRHNEARLHFAMKMLDEKGQGRYTFDQLVENFCSDNETRLFSTKRLKGILHSGNNLFWAYYPDLGIVFYYSAARIADALELDSVGSKQVVIPIDAVFCPIKTFKAFCHQSFLASVGKSPISRKKLESVVGVSDDTMRSYENNVKTKQNIVLLCEGFDPQSAEYQEYIWQHGRCFKIKINGKIYTAYRTANSYLSPIELVSFGKTARKAINKHLKFYKGQVGNFLNRVFYWQGTGRLREGEYYNVTETLNVDLSKQAKLSVANVWQTV